MRSFRLSVLMALGAFAAACSSTPKTTPELGKLEGKKVALVEVTGPENTPTAAAVVEVALVNQLVKRGTFELVGKKELLAAQDKPEAGVTQADRDEVARKVGADYALRVRVLQFDSQTRESYSAVEEEDSQLKEERGDGKTTRTFKVKSLTASVQVEMEFKDLKTGEIRKAIADSAETVTADAKTEAIHLPPTLRFLEKVSNAAFAKFFDQYN